MVICLYTVPPVYAGQSLDARISLGNGTRISEGGPNTISFSGLKSIGTNIVAYNWQLDEGEIITGETVSYEFSRPDNDDIWTYMLSLEIENAAGNQTTSYMQIEVGQNSLRYKPYQEKSKKQFYLADHLGNIRATVDDAAEIASQDAYYPFGKRMPNLSSENADGEARYKYNGKELDDEHGLNWLAYGARYYDPEIGRWHVVDPLAENSLLNPFNYVNNSPIKMIDPDGKWPFDPAGLIAGIATFSAKIQTKLVEEVNEWNQPKRYSPTFTASNAQVADMALNDVKEGIRNSFSEETQQDIIAVAETVNEITDVVSPVCAIGAIVTAEVPPVSGTFATVGATSTGVNIASDLTLGIMKGESSQFFEASINLLSVGSGNLAGRYARDAALPGLEDATEALWSSAGSFLPGTIMSKTHEKMNNNTGK